jgi:hypothetical protein
VMAICRISDSLYSVFTGFVALESTPSEWKRGNLSIFVGSISSI